MSIIRALALDLYKAQQAVAKLEKTIAGAAPVEKETLIRELRAAQKEVEMLRKMLDGKKESGLPGRKSSMFGGFNI